MDSVESTKWIWVERISLNECISDAYIPDKSKPDIDRESDAETYTGPGVNCLDVIFKWGIHWPYITLLDILILMLTYIYSMAQWKLSPNRRNVAQSGHTGWHERANTYLHINDYVIRRLGLMENVLWCGKIFNMTSLALHFISNVSKLETIGVGRVARSGDILTFGKIFIVK
jgi:hypothetical protein